MNKKFKGVIAILVLSISFFMMITLKHTHALGDYVLQFIGLRPWTGEYSGMHLTIFYFGALAILGLILVRKYVIDDLGVRGRNVFLIFIVIMTIFTFATNTVVVSIKGNSEGLFSIGYNSKDSNISYAYEDMKYSHFRAEVEMRNYGDETKEFQLTIGNPFHREEETEGFDIYDKNGKRVVFSLEGNETRIFRIDLEEYDIVSGKFLFKGSRGSGKGSIREVILSDDKGNTIRLDENNFFGIEISK